MSTFATIRKRSAKAKNHLLKTSTMSFSFAPDFFGMTKGRIMDETVEYLGMTAGIVSSYVSNNSLSPSDLPALIREVHVALCQAGNGQTNQGKAPVLPAVSIKKSIMPDYLICLEDGKKFKSLKRHISTHYNLSPEEYREKWGLPADYPMVAPNYAKARSALARKMGLGQQRAPAKPSNKRGS